MKMCVACPLHLTRTQVVCPVGPHDARIVLVGEAPGATEDKGGEPFTGAAGKRLDWLLQVAGVKRTDVLITNCVMCRPPSNRKPKAAELKACRHWLVETIQGAHPDVVVPLGDFALKAILGKGYTLKVWHGRRTVVSPEPQGLFDVPTTVVPNYHPAATLHNPNLSPVLIADFKNLPNELRRADVGYIAHGTLDVKGALALLKDAKEFAFDYETTWVKDRVGDVVPVGWSVAVPGVERAFFTRIPADWLAMYLASTTVTTIAHNAQFEYQVLKAQGIPLHNVWDTKLAAYVLGYPNTTLKGLVLQIFGYKMHTLEELSDGFKVAVEDIAPALLAHYGADDAWWTLRLKEVLAQELVEGGLDEMYHRIELPLIPVIGDMMAAGIEVDKTALESAGVRLGELAAQKALALRSMLGDINLNSGDQLATVLFGHGEGQLGYPVIKLTDSGDRPSTDKDVLELLAQLYPVAQEILDYRHVVKLKTTYAEGILERTGIRTRIFAHFNQAGGFEDRDGGNSAEAPRTGRLSSSGPNLTNIPKHDAPGLELVAPLIRRCFVARRDTSLVVGALSQEEFRIAAFLSQDPAMLDIINNKRDWHRETAIDAFGHEPSELERFYGKTTNFSLLNGSHVATVAHACKSTRAVAQLLYDGFHRKYTRYQQWRLEVQAEIERTGYATTFYGRRRYLPGAWSSDARQREAAIRQGINVPIQGTAADVLKLAMRRLWERLQNHETQMVSCVHDEIVVEALDKEVPYVVQCLREMTRGLLGNMALPVEVKVGHNWAERTDDNPQGLVLAAH